ncbi:MAG: SBBP repeat-containing protein, partial [Saprospiraceae bacterium]
MIKLYFLIYFTLCLLAGSPYAQSPSLNWVTNIGSTDNDEGYSIAIDDSSNVYTLGLFSGAVDFDPSTDKSFILTSNGVGNSDIFITKYNSLGELKWAKRIGNSSENEIGRSIALDASNNICITGNFEGLVDFNPGTGSNIFNLTSFGGADIFVLKLDNAGQFLWAKQMGGLGDDFGYSIDVNS